MAGDRLVRAAHHALIVFLVVGSMLVLSAQAVVDPRYVEFNASANHNTLHTDGSPIVANYVLSIYPQGSSTAFATMNLGKPAPDASSVIRVDFLPLLPTLPTPGVNYEARVTALGPGGATASTASNGFSFTGPCAPGISPTSRTVSSSATTGSVAVTNGAGCAWSAVSNAGWITLTGSTSGSGNGTVAYSIAANTSTTQRQGSVTIAGQTFSVTQSGLSCTYSLSPTNGSVNASGGGLTTSMTAAAGCAWTATSNAPSWLTVSTGGSGSGNGTVTLAAAANTATQTRQGTVTIGGQTFTVNQAGVACTFSLNPTSASAVAAGGNGTTSVTTPAGCAWTAASNAPGWLSVTGTASGSGNGTISFSTSANSSSQTRQGTLTIGGQTFTVNQAGVACSYALTPVVSSVGASGGSAATSMTAPAGCAWTATSNAPSWLTVSTGGSGSGNGTVTLAASANTVAQTRQGTVTIGGQTFTVNQAAAGCTFSLNPTSASAVAAGGNGTTSVTALAGCAWTAASNAPGWLTVTAGSSGSGNGTISFSTSANSSSQARQGTLTIGGQTFTVNQAGVACTFSLSPVNASVAAAGGSGSTAVTAPAGCAWSAASNATGWLSVTGTASGSGNGTISFSASANSGSQTRQGTLTIGGQTFTVNQAGVACSYALTPVVSSVGAGGGSVATSMTAPAGCAWTAVTNAPSWLTVSTGGSGNGNGTVTLAASTNTVAQTRQGTVTIGGQTFTVNQAAAGCTFTLNPTSASAAATGANGTTAVSAPPGCAWTATSNVPSWLIVTAGGSGSGGGTIGYSVSSNPQAQTRQGTITIGGQTFTVNQAAGSCSLSINPGSLSAPSNGTGGSTTITGPAGCAWTAQSNAAWLTFTTATSGTGNGSIGFTVAASTSSSQRTGTMTIAGSTFTVTQAANTGCQYTINSASQSVQPGGGTATVALTTGPNCFWTATTTAGWMTLNISGSGSRSIEFTVAPNTTGSSRSGTLTIAGRTHTVTQASGTVPNAPRGLRVVIAINGGS